MANRTFNLQGRAFSPNTNPVSVSLTWNGQSVFNDVVPTQPNAPVDPGTDLDALFYWEWPANDTAPVQVSITVTGGDLILGPFMANYVRSDETIVPAALAEQAVANLVNQQPSSIELQQAVAPYLQPYVTADIYNKLVAGTLTYAEGLTLPYWKNSGPDILGLLAEPAVTKSNITLNGQTYPISDTAHNPILTSGDVMTFTFDYSGELLPYGNP